MHLACPTAEICMGFPCNLLFSHASRLPHSRDLHGIPLQSPLFPCIPPATQSKFAWDSPAIFSFPMHLACHAIKICMGFPRNLLFSHASRPARPLQPPTRPLQTPARRLQTPARQPKQPQLPSPNSSTRKKGRPFWPLGPKETPPSAFRLRACSSVQSNSSCYIIF